VPTSDGDAGEPATISSGSTAIGHIIFLRENQPHKALLLLQELARDFPQNPLARDQIARVTERINRIRKNGK
jgi:hypothetical protein